MSVETTATAGRGRDSVCGVLSLVAALIALAGVTMVGLASFIDGFNPPDWVRVAAMAPIPFAVVAAVPLGLFGLRGDRRGAAFFGLLLTGLSVAAFVVMVVKGG